jgi:hypothetical protein
MEKLRVQEVKMEEEVLLLDAEVEKEKTSLRNLSVVADLRKLALSEVLNIKNLFPWLEITFQFLKIRSFEVVAYQGFDEMLK